MTQTLHELLNWLEGNRSELARELGCSRSQVTKIEDAGYIGERYALPAGRLAKKLASRSVRQFAYEVLQDAEGARAEGEGEP